MARVPSTRKAVTATTITTAACVFSLIRLLSAARNAERKTCTGTSHTRTSKACSGRPQTVQMRLVGGGQREDYKFSRCWPRTSTPKSCTGGGPAGAASLTRTLRMAHRQGIEPCIAGLESAQHPGLRCRAKEERLRTGLAQPLFASPLSVARGRVADTAQRGRDAVPVGCHPIPRIVARLMCGKRAEENVF